MTQRDPDQGAVAVLFALLLVVLIGFVGAGIDVTSAYAKTQEVQNGADAGALAAAQQCATKEGCAGNGALAAELLASNLRNDVNPTAVVTYPAANKVRVVAEDDHQNLFLGLFMQKTFRIREEATASWATPKSGPATLPLTISECNFMDVTGGAPALDVSVTIYLPKVNNGEGGPEPTACPSGTAPPGGFGWLDANSSCESAMDVVVGSTYVTGSDPGLAAENCLKVLLAQMVVDQEVVLIPIYSARTPIGGQQAEYFVERFAAFKLTGYYLQNGNTGGGESCAKETGGEYTKTCLVGRFISWAELGDDFETGAPKTEVAVITLDD